MSRNVPQDQELLDRSEEGLRGSRHGDSLRSRTLSINGATELRQPVPRLPEHQRSRLLADGLRRDGQTHGAMIRTNVKQMSLRHSILALFVGFVSLGATFVAGCESQVNAYCISRCDCQGCSQRERADCLDDVEDSERVSAHDGCAEEFATYVQCYVNEGSCTNGGWIASTCSSEATAFRTCSARSARFVKTACAEERDKRVACDVPGGGADPCLGADECTAYCALAATCEELADPPEGSAYVNCIIDCTNANKASGGQ